MTFFISVLVLARDSHIKHDSKAGGLTWVEGWYQGRYGKFHVIIFLSHILHWPFPSIDFYIAKKIFELTNCKNKSLRELFALGANIRSCPQISVFALIYPYLPPNKTSDICAVVSKYKERWCIKICIKSYFNQINQHIGIKFK
jgi:hypothetical protein